MEWDVWSGTSKLLDRYTYTNGVDICACKSMQEILALTCKNRSHQLLCILGDCGRKGVDHIVDAVTQRLQLSLNP